MTYTYSTHLCVIGMFCVILLPVQMHGKNSQNLYGKLPMGEKKLITNTKSDKRLKFCTKYLLIYFKHLVLPFTISSKLEHKITLKR